MEKYEYLEKHGYSFENKTQKNKSMPAKKKEDKIVKFPEVQKFKEIKQNNNYTFASLEKKTGVKRSVLENFLNNLKINYIDYRKIIKTFPEIDIRETDTVLESHAIEMFGTITDGGKVRHLLLNDENHFITSARVPYAFTKGALIGLHHEYSNAKFIFQARQDTDVFNANFDGQEVLLKTLTESYYGVIKSYGNNYRLHSISTREPFDLKQEDIVESYDLLMRLNKKWSDLKSDNIKIVRKQNYHNIDS